MSRTISTLSSQLEVNIIKHDSIIAIESTVIIETTEAWGAFVALRKVVGCLKTPLKVAFSLDAKLLYFNFERLAEATEDAGDEALAGSSTKAFP